MGDLLINVVYIVTYIFQVQFRLKQIINSDANERENLLKELDQFADSGIPDVKSMKEEVIYPISRISSKKHWGYSGQLVVESRLC